MIDVYGERKDTTFVSWHPDNTVKEFNYTYLYEGAPVFNAFLPLYDGGKISGIQMGTHYHQCIHV